jgi:nicotinamidase-related amidase
MTALSREVPIDPAHAALLVIDVQNYCAGPQAGKTEYFRRSLRDAVMPNIRRLQTACRSGGIEVMYSVVEDSNCHCEPQRSNLGPLSARWSRLLRRAARASQ